MKYSCVLLAVCSVSAASLSEEVFTSIRNNDLAGVRGFAEKPESREVRGRQNMTPLMYAAAFGSYDSVKVLLDAGADVNSKDALEGTALIYGAWEPGRTKLLANKGADLNARSKQGQTALIVAASAASNGETVKFLLEAGARPEGKVLINAAPYDLDVVRLLIAKGVDVNSANESGITPLQQAAGYGQLATIKLLLSKGANVNAANTHANKVRHGEIALRKLTALMLAVPHGSPELVKTLLDSGADVNARDIRGMTPLMFAVSGENQNPRIVDLLLAKGAEINAKSEVGETALDWARKFGNPAVIGLLEKKGAKASDREEKIAEAAPAGSPRAAMERSIALLQKTGASFFRESGCPACHNVGITGFTIARARSAGIPVDDKAAAEMTRSIVASTAPAGPILIQRIPIGGTFRTATFILDGMAAYGLPADATSDSLVAYLAGFQNPDGTFGASEGISRAPMDENPTGRTAFAVRALRAYSWPARQAEFDQRIARARAWLLQAKPTTSYAQAEQLLGLKWADASREDMSKIAKLLLAEQRKDGGWAQNRNLQSDAYATGLAMWALNESGTVRATDAAYRRGIDYLMRTQRGDGSWYVRSRAPEFQPYFEGGFPYGHDQWISSTATAYAAIALAPAAAPATVAAAQ